MDLIEAVRGALGAVIAVAGLAILILGAIGNLRFPDFYTRLHPASADALGAMIVLVGLAVMSGEGAVSLRLLLLGALIMALAPTLAQFLAGAAHAAGLAPLAGRYMAPRPGGRRQTP